jgi:hypothetical protein
LPRLHSRFIPAFPQGHDDDSASVTPIKHLMVIIGENRTFDHVRGSGRGLVPRQRGTANPSFTMRDSRVVLRFDPLALGVFEKGIATVSRQQSALSVRRANRFSPIRITESGGKISPWLSRRPLVAFRGSLLSDAGPPVNGPVGERTRTGRISMTLAADQRSGAWIHATAARLKRLYTALVYDVMDEMRMPHQCLDLAIKPLDRRMRVCTTGASRS